MRSPSLRRTNSVVVFHRTDPQRQLSCVLIHPLNVVMRTLAFRALHAVHASAIRFRFGFDDDDDSLSLRLEEARARSIVNKRTTNERTFKEPSLCDLARPNTNTRRP